MHLIVVCSQVEQTSVSCHVLVGRGAELICIVQGCHDWVILLFVEVLINNLQGSSVDIVVGVLLEILKVI